MRFNLPFFATIAENHPKINSRINFNSVPIPSLPAWIRPFMHSQPLHPINILSVSYSLNLNQFQLSDDFVNHTVIAEANPVGVFRTA